MHSANPHMRIPIRLNSSIWSIMYICYTLAVITSCKFSSIIYPPPPHTHRYTHKHTLTQVWIFYTKLLHPCLRGKTAPNTMVYRITVAFFCQFEKSSHILKKIIFQYFFTFHLFLFSFFNYFLFGTTTDKKCFNRG